MLVYQTTNWANLESAEGEEEKVSPRKPLPPGAKGFALPGMGMAMGDLAAVKLKKAGGASPAKPTDSQPQAEQVDFRSMLKPSAKKQ